VASSKLRLAALFPYSSYNGSAIVVSSTEATASEPDSKKAKLASNELADLCVGGDDNGYIVMKINNQNEKCSKQ
jgi:hypothetical protein